MFSLVNLNIFSVVVAIIVFTGICSLLSLCIVFVKTKLTKTNQYYLTINKKTDSKIEVVSGEKLLSVLHREGFNIPSSCGGKGSCHQCKIKILDNKTEPLEIEKAAFSIKDIQDGWRLSCQNKICEDVNIELPKGSLNAKEYKGKVLSSVDVASFIKEITIQLDEDSKFSYAAGNYVQIQIPSYKANTDDWIQKMPKIFASEWIKSNFSKISIDYVSESEKIVRAYSIASYPGETNILKLNIRISFPIKGNNTINWGCGSSYMYSLIPGDEISFSGPYGESLMIDDARDVFFLIGGAGVSFARTHIFDLFKSKKTKRKIELWYGARSLKECVYKKEFEQLESEFNNFKYNLVLSNLEEEDIKNGWPKDDPIKTNLLFRAFEEGCIKKLLYPTDYLFYVCGPPLHNKSVLKLLTDYGVEKDCIVLDDFGN